MQQMEEKSANEDLGLLVFVNPMSSYVVESLGKILGLIRQALESVVFTFSLSQSAGLVSVRLAQHSWAKREE
ncbi:hypothetical protein GmHk_14G041523 [Glycine max]|nr:hypothetical protein GmHk_14G041523 [Glycine max]